MFDIGWTEMLVVAIVAILFVGPKELPGMLRTFGQMARKVRGLVGDAKQQFNEAVREAELDGVKDSINQVRDLDPTKQIKDKLNPLKSALNDTVADEIEAPAVNAEAEAAERKRKFEEIAAAAQASGTSAVPGLGTAKPADAAAAKPAAKSSTKAKSTTKPKAAAKPKAATKTASKPSGSASKKPAAKVAPSKAAPKRTAAAKAAAKPAAKSAAKKTGAKA